MADARQIGINISEGRKLVTQAIAAGKKRDFENAIALVRESKKTIESAINQHIVDSISTIQNNINSLSEAGKDINELNDMMAKVQSLHSEQEYMEAIELSKKTSEIAQNMLSELKTTVKKEEHAVLEGDIDEKLKTLVEFIKKGEEVKVDVNKTKTLMTEARKALKRDELEKAEELLKQAKEDFLRELPKLLTEEISNSKSVLYQAKMQGQDIRPSIKYLKEANTALKLDNYIDAMEAIKRYRTEMNQFME